MLLSKITNNPHEKTIAAQVIEITSFRRLRWDLLQAVYSASVAHFLACGGCRETSWAATRLFGNILIGG
jgi:hypothetical protein